MVVSWSAAGVACTAAANPNLPANCVSAACHPASSAVSCFLGIHRKCQNNSGARKRTLVLESFEFDLQQKRPGSVPSGFFFTPCLKKEGHLVSNTAIMAAMQGASVTRVSVHALSRAARGLLSPCDIAGSGCCEFRRARAAGALGGLAQGVAQKDRCEQMNGRAHGRCAGAGRVAESRGSAACFTATARRHARRARRPIVLRLRRSDVGGEDRGSWQGCEGWRYRAPLKDVAHLRACVSGVSRNPRPRPRTSL